MLNKIINIFFILEILGKKENKIYILKINKILSIQTIDQIFYLVFLSNNNSINKVKIRKMSCYLNI